MSTDLVDPQIVVLQRVDEGLLCLPLFSKIFLNVVFLKKIKRALLGTKGEKPVTILRCVILFFC